MELFIIAGPNGVGKTTFAREFLPHFADCKNFVNADLIAQGVAPFSPEGAAFRAGRMMLNEIQSFSKRRDPFAFETTLSGRSYISLIRRLKRKGYKVYLFFLCVENVEVALSRIRQRVMKGADTTSLNWWCAGASIARSTISFGSISQLWIRGIYLTTQVQHR
jgi:predicted ABC-type ATPase